MASQPAGGGGQQTTPAAGWPDSGQREPEWPEAGWRQPSPRLRLVRHGQLVVTTIPVLVAAVVLPAAAGGGALLAVVAGVAVVVVAAVVDVFLGRRVRSWGYAERDDDLLVRRGVMFRRLSIIPYGRMQFVDVTAGPI